MTFENVKPVTKLPLKLDLQFFADGEDDDTGNDDLSGEEELMNAIRSLQSQDDDDNDDELDDDTDDTDDDDDSEDDDMDFDDEDDTDDEDDSDDELDDEDDNQPPVTKKKQSKEENARFAEQRRLEQAEQRALEKLRSESPEFKLAEMLSEQFGKPVEEIMAQIQEEAMKAEAKKSGRDIEDVRRERQTQDELTQLREQIAMLNFQNWETQIKADGSRLISEYKGILNQEDIDKATDYILNVAKNVELPLEDAVFAVHGKKIVQGLAKGKVQDELANASGRKKKTPLPPNNGKQKKVVTLSADEQYIARQFGMSDDEYNKFKK